MWSKTNRRFPTRESYATWLLAFFYADFDTLTPGQELDWREGALDFAGSVGGGVIVERGGGLNPTDNLPTVAVLRALQDKLTKGYAASKRGEDWVERLPSTAALLVLDKGYVRTGSRKIWRREYRAGRFRELFVAAMWEVLVEAGSQINVCPTCTKYFLKSRKQEYCSPVCAQKARWARFTANRPPRDYRREREQAIKNRLGPTARVRPQRRHG